MYDWLKNLFSNKYKTGLLLDTRSQPEKDRDYLHEEIAMGTQPSVWGKKEDIKNYPFENQNATQSCVAHAGTLAMGIQNEAEGSGFIRLSKAFPYVMRSNFPGEGMILQDMGNIARNFGSCVFDMLPTPTYEADINKKKITQPMRDNAENFKIKNYVAFKNTSDINAFNEITTSGKALVILIYATYQEWAQEYPKVMGKVTLGAAPIRHAVCVLPHGGFMENGVKYLMIQDSVADWGKQRRCLSEDFIKQRCYGAMYFLELPNPVVSTKPKHFFTIPMRYGDGNYTTWVDGVTTKYEEVTWLQKCLAYEGLFIGQPTGSFYGITLKAVNDFQNKYAAEILIPNGLTRPTGIVGESTMAKLNSLYAN